MKMKSIFSSLNAKLALAVLAVGTMFASCYDSENGDVTVNVKPDPAKYYIAGNVTNAETGEKLEGAVITMNGEPVNYTGSAFNVEVTGGTSYEFVVDLDGYYTATRTIYMPTIPDGGVSVGNADFALVSVLADELLPEDPESGDLATSAEAQVALDQHEDAILATLDGIEGITSRELIVDEFGNLRLVAEANITAAAEGEDKDVTLPYYHGFVSTVPQSAEGIFTRAITEGSIWNASAENVLDMDYGLTFTVEPRTVTLSGVEGAAINGYTFVVYFTNKVLSFGGYKGTVTYQGEWYVVPTYDSHDNHDLHNILHGNHNGAGGGSSME